MPATNNTPTAALITRTITVRAMPGFQGPCTQRQARAAEHAFNRLRESAADEGVSMQRLYAAAGI